MKPTSSFISLTEAARRAGRSPRFFAGRAALHGLVTVGVEVGGGRVLHAIPADAAESLTAELVAESRRFGLPAASAPAVQ